MKPNTFLKKKQEINFMILYQNNCKKKVKEDQIRQAIFFLTLHTMFYLPLFSFLFSSFTILLFSLLLLHLLICFIHFSFHHHHHQISIVSLLTTTTTTTTTFLLFPSTTTTFLLFPPPTKGQKVDFLCLYKKRVWFHCEC